MSNALVDLISPFMAFGILRMRGVGGYAGWRWLFLIEGLFTLIVGLCSFVMMPSSPTASKTWFWKKGWYTEREEIIQVNRIIRDDPSKGSMHNRQGLTLKQIWRSSMEMKLWPLYLLGFTFGMPDYPVANYLTLNLRTLGFNTFETNLLSMPCAAIAAMTLILVTVCSERFNTRAFVGMAQNVWYLPGFIALYTLPNSASKWSFWGVITYILSAPLVHAINVGWVSRQSGSVSSRVSHESKQCVAFLASLTSTIPFPSGLTSHRRRYPRRCTTCKLKELGLEKGQWRCMLTTLCYTRFRQLSAIAGANVYNPNDAPLYRKGNLAMMILNICNIFLYCMWKASLPSQAKLTLCPGIAVFAYVFYKTINRLRDRKWNAMTKVSG